MVDQDPRQIVMDLIRGYQAINLLREVVRLNIPDILAAQPRTMDELASITGTYPPALFRVLEDLVARGVFDMSGNALLTLNEQSQLLLTDSPGSLRPMILYVGGEHIQKAWTELGHTLNTGEAAFVKANGTQVWQYLDEHPDTAQIFNEYMLQWSRPRHQAVVDAYDFSGINLLADIGGGIGGYITYILDAYSAMNGILFDRPAVEKDAVNHLRRRNLDSRCRFQGGSFFEAVPEGADAYFLAHVLHDWADEEARRILETCRLVMNPSDRLIVDEVLAAPGTGANLNMMVSFGDARNRTEEEFKRLIEDCGFTCTRVIRTKGDSTILEAMPV